MECSTAIELINILVYLPAWKFTATDNTKRFEGCVKVRIDYPAQMSERAEAPLGYPTAMMTYAEFKIMACECPDETTLYRRLFDDCIMRIHRHEGREFLRVTPTFWAPFHPHKAEGMRRYGDPNGDLNFGVA